MPRIVNLILLCLCVLFLAPAASRAQSWTGLLNPVSGAGACSPANITTAQKCGSSNWSSVGVVSGIPNRTTICSTLTSGASLASINSALSACPAGQVVLLGAGTYTINGTVNVPSNVTLRGAGTLSTILNTTGTSGSAIQMGSGGPNYNTPAAHTITAGATAGSNSITLDSVASVSVGTLLAVSELNDPVYVTINSANGACTWCDGTGDGGVRTRGQIVQVTNVTGTTVTFTPPLYSNYGSATGTGPALVYYFPVSVHDAGVENLQVFANGTGYSQTWGMSACANCWIKGVFDNYADGDHASIFWSFHVEIRDSYFSNAYDHSPGTFDADVNIGDKTSESLLENNIFERLHVGSFVRWGAAGNVVGYNYEIGNFDASATSVILAMLLDHGAHPQFTLYEGNIGNNLTKDAFWGTSSNITIFRNQFRGTDTLASPLTTGRNVVNWSSTTLANQQLMGEQLAFPHTNINSIGNVLGSADANTAATSGKYNSGAAPFTSTIIPPATRTYDKFFSAVSIGYNTGSDTNGSSVTTFAGGPSNTAGYWVGKATGTFFQHGNFDISSGATIWNGSVTHTLPPSFYKTAKPSWFGSVPWPPIGPDVSGGTVDSTILQGHVYANPAEVCYNSTARDANGLKLFDPNVCYGATPPPPPPPNPPTMRNPVIF